MAKSEVSYLGRQKKYKLANARFLLSKIYQIPDTHNIMCNIHFFANKHLHII